MKSRRNLKASQAILETVSTVILSELKDPRVRNVTVLGVDLSPDMRHAKVSVSVLGDEKAQELCLHGLNSARGFLQAKVANRLKSRNTPILRFVLDQGVKKSIEASRIIREVLPQDAEEELTSEPGREDEPGVT